MASKEGFNSHVESEKKILSLVSKFLNEMKFV